MTELKNTPGPWKVIEGGWENSFICANDGTLIAICKIHTETTQKTRSKYKEIKQANADLLADAWQLPDLRQENTELKEINKELVEVLKACEELQGDVLKEIAKNTELSQKVQQLEEKNRALKQAGDCLAYLVDSDVRDAVETWHKAKGEAE